MHILPKVEEDCLKDAEWQGEECHLNIPRQAGRGLAEAQGHRFPQGQAWLSSCELVAFPWSVERWDPWGPPAGSLLEWPGGGRREGKRFVLQAVSQQTLRPAKPGYTVGDLTAL